MVKYNSNCRNIVGWMRRAWESLHVWCTSHHCGACSCLPQVLLSCHSPYDRMWNYVLSGKDPMMWRTLPIVISSGNQLLLGQLVLQVNFSECCPILYLHLVYTSVDSDYTHHPILLAHRNQCTHASCPTMVEASIGSPLLSIYRERFHWVSKL